MRIIYEPTGKALEYSPLAVSWYRWCFFRCKYCFVPQYTHSPTGQQLPPFPRKEAMHLLDKDCRELEKAGDTREILASFTTDPYQPIDDKFRLTRKAIQIFHRYNRPYSILTKAGQDSTRDFDIMEQRPDLARYATTLTLTDPEDMKIWEPYASPWQERVNALKEAKGRGIRTWASVEPIISPAQSLYLIAETMGSVDQYRIGIMNHGGPEVSVKDLQQFLRHATALLETHNIDFMIKKDTLKLFDCGGI
jgi:DNA repair photolyase